MARNLIEDFSTRIAPGKKGEREGRKVWIKTDRKQQQEYQHGHIYPTQLEEGFRVCVIHFRESGTRKIVRQSKLKAKTCCQQTFAAECLAA